MARETILVVDDNAQIADFLTEHLLPRLGYDTLTARDGRAALKKVRAHQPDLMLLDLRLPDISGLDVLHQLAEEGRSVPTILFTAYGSEQVAVDAFRLGVQDYLIKPVDPDDLAAAIDRAASESRLRREKNRLTAQLQQQATRLTVLSKVGQSITSTLELDEVLRRIVEAGVYLTQADEGFLALQDSQTDQLYLRATKNLGQSEGETLRLKIGDSLVTQVQRTGHALRLTHSPGMGSLKVSTGFLVHSLLYVPLVSRGRCLGVLAVDNRVGQRAFGEMDEMLLCSLADYAAIAIENARLYTETGQQLLELQMLEEASRTILSTLNLDERLNHILAEITARMNTQVASILLIDKQTNELVFQAVVGPEADKIRGLRLPLGHGVVGHVAQTRRSVLIPDARQSDLFDESVDETSGFVTRSLVCAPMIMRQEMIGVIEVLNKEEGPFGEADRRLLEKLAQSAALAIENARLYDEATRRTVEVTSYAKDLEALHAEERKQRQSLDRLRSTFLNAIGHELTTPISIMIQTIETLTDPRGDELLPAQAEMVETLRLQAQSLQRMIGRLIAFAGFAAKREDLSFCLTPLDAVLDDALQLARFKAQSKEIALEDLRPKDLPSLMIDGERLSEALVNLLENAIRFSPPRAPVILSSRVSANRVEISVQDFGPGIAPEDQAHIWDAFSQINQSLQRGLEGLGLGLAMTRYLVEAHGGAVHLESALDRGSTFTISLPRQHKTTGLLTYPLPE
ncbi:MAG: GAF domain-containing protein [Chloroflexota bacterium]